MRIIIYSHPTYAQTGFGKVVKNLASHLSKNHDVFIAPIVGHGGSATFADGYQLLSIPGQLDFTPRWIAKWAKDLKADLIIQHFDIWMLKAGWILDMPCPVITYSPVDCYPLPNNFVEAVQGAKINVAMSNHAEMCFMEEDLPSIYIPHGVNLDLYSFKKDAREKIGMPQDSFIIGMVVTNGSTRKNIGGQIEAFADFIKTSNIDAYLYIHTQSLQTTPESFDINVLVEKLNIVGKVILPDPDTYAIGFAEDIMPYIYSSFDVLLQCTLGEGFGLPIIEAQSCGVPVIGTNCSAIPDIIGEGGDIIFNGTSLMLPYSLSNFRVPDNIEISNTLLTYTNKKYLSRKKKAALENAQKYSWELVFSKWDELLASL